MHNDLRITKSGFKSVLISFLQKGIKAEKVAFSREGWDEISEMFVRLFIQSM